MSMHEFEDLVESSVNCLAQSKTKTSQELRSLFWNLYQFQESWDTGFTQLRVIDTLLKHNFVYQFKLTQHPDYAAHKAFFDSAREFTFVGLHPEEKWNGETNPTVGYIEPPYLYCDAGSPLWQKFVEAGLLTGDDALPPVEMAIQDTAKEVIVEAKEQSNPELVSLWYSALGLYLWSFHEEAQLEEAKSDTSIKAIRDIVQETGALDLDPGHGFLQQPPPEALEEYPYLFWWFQSGK